MTKFLTMSALIGMFVVVNSDQASAWDRKSTVTTPRGVYASQGTGGCAGGTCTRTGSTVGPNGGAISRTGSVTRTEPGQVDYSRTTTGPNGVTVSRSGTISSTAPGP